MGLMSCQLYAADFSNSTMFPKDIEWNFVDEKRAGDVSVVVFKNESSDRTLAHQAIFVDVEGNSNESLLHGVMIHLLADPSTKITKYWIKDHRWKKDAFDEIIPVGRLHPSSPSPFGWAVDLEVQGYEIYHYMTDHCTNKIWSSSVNCQMFVRKWLKRNDFEWPSDVSFANDGVLPVIIDESIRRVCLMTTTEITNAASMTIMNRLRTLADLFLHLC